MGDHFYYDYDAEYQNRYPGRNAINNIIDHHSENKTAYGTLYLGIAAVSAIGCTLFYFYRKKRRENLGYNRTSSEILNEFNLDDSDVPLVSARTNNDSNILTPRALRSQDISDASWLDEDVDVVIPRVLGYIKKSAPVQGISKFGKNSWKKLQNYAVDNQKPENSENWENSIDSEKSSSFGNVTINLSREDLEATLRNLRLPPRRSTSLLKSVGKVPFARTSSLASVSNKKISRNRALRRERSRLHQEFLKVKTVDSEIEEEEEDEEELVHKPTPSKKFPETPETLRFK